MAYKLTLSDLKKSPVKSVAGVCVDSAAFLDLANEVMERLMKRGNFWDTEWLVQLCVTDKCLTLPNYVGTVLGVRFCNGVQATIHNNWYSILGQSGCGSGFNADIAITDAGTAPCYREVTGETGKLIRYYVVKQQDIGQKITIYGTQYGGQPLQELDANGNWKDGLTLIAASPFVSTTIAVTKITSVVREATQGTARLYEYDAVTDKVRDLAAYDPNETNPRYRRSIIENFCSLPGCADVNNIKQVQVQALVKLAFVPLKNDNDFLLIDDMTAMKFGFQAVKLEEANDDVAAEVKWLKAISELNFQQRDKNPSQTSTVYVDSYQGRGIMNPN